MSRKLKLALVSEVFPPQNNSGAIQLRDLTREFVNQSHQVTAIVPCEGQAKAWQLEDIDGVRVLRLKSPRSRDTGYIQRTIGEIIMPFAMSYYFRQSPLANETWDGVIWYSPSIFHGPFVNMLKKSSKCKGYLILRDIFPDWAVDVGLLRKGGIPHRFFSAVAKFQYSVADIIGLQTQGNSKYFLDWAKKPAKRLEVLPNWLGKPVEVRTHLRVSNTLLRDRKIFVYAGNMGLAQGSDIFLELARKLEYRKDIGFLFVCRGSEVARLKKDSEVKGLSNVLFFDEIPSDEIPDLYSQCSVGIVALDVRHKSHNISGKYLSYLQSGLPVLANVNTGNDLATMIRKENVGQVCENNHVEELYDLTLKLLKQMDSDEEMSKRCRNLFEKEYSVYRSVTQIVDALIS